MHKLTVPELKILHHTSFKSKSILDTSKCVGCFHCMTQFDASEITSYIENGETAECPFCDIDAVMPLAPFNNQQDRTDVLQQMHDYFFSN